MGKRQVRVVPVPKPVSLALLVLVTAAIAGLLYFLSGKAYADEAGTTREMLALLLGSGSDPVSRGAFLAFLMPVIANVLLFVPWGFLAFIVIDSPKQSRAVTYAITLVGATIVALAMYAWQQFLPTRVTSLLDAFTNGLGAVGGAALGHARKRVRIRFEV